MKEGLKERKVFIKYYEKLISLLPVQSITPGLVTAEVITTNDAEEIRSNVDSAQKASFLLNKIARSLDSGYPDGFYALLAIMQEKGGDISKLAKDINKELETGMYKAIRAALIGMYVYTCSNL